MNDKAKKLLRRAIEIYRTEDGASDTGCYRDAVTDIYHLAFIDEKVHKSIGIKPNDNLELWARSLAVLFEESYLVFIEEKEIEEHEKIAAVKEKDLPLYINDKWMFNSSQQYFEKKLKNKEKTDVC
jgi:hypothetical protein